MVHAQRNSRGGRPFGLVRTAPAQDRPGGFEATWNRDGDPPVLVLAGELDISTVPVLRAALAGWHPDQDLIIDGRRLTFVAAAGLHTLLVAQSEALWFGRTVGVRDPSPQLRRLLELTHTESLLQVSVR